ncbi:MAG: hypothetical protein QY316_02710 [Thermodesulfobacteriota bacterium]|nr:MAG: hypothetical protein QY316_02710 [Thermodesulfobacteriota bacterium]
MAERPVIIVRDEDKARLQAPVWTPQERDEALRMLLKKAVAG